MNETVIRNICLEEFNALPDSVKRNRVGIAAYAYTIEINDAKYVLKISETKELIDGSIYWLKKLESLALPIPKIVSANSGTSPCYFIMSYIPGRDLGLAYDGLSNEQKKTIAHELHRHQNALRTLPAAKGYGFLHSYEDQDNLKKSWRDVVENHIGRSERRIAENKIFSTDYIRRVRSFLHYFSGYFDGIKPEPFFDDATTKNVLIDQGRMSGIIDLDWICFGDRLYALALTTMSLLCMHADLEYVEYWKELEKPGEIQDQALVFYILVFCIDFMSEKGMRFNMDEEIKINNEEKAFLENVFESYYKTLQQITAPI